MEDKPNIPDPSKQPSEGQVTQPQTSTTTPPDKASAPETSVPSQSQVNPPIGQQTGIQVPQPTLGVQRPVTSSSENLDKTKVSRKKLLLFFLIGLFTHFFGLILGGLWIALKVKENKKPRFLSLLAGLGAAIIVGIIFNILISPKLQSTLVNKYPEMAYIPNELVKDYPNAQFGINIQSTKYISGEKEGTASSTLTVSVSADQLISKEDRKIIAEKVCTLLESNNDSYDNVKISQVSKKKLLFFYYDQSFAEERTCQEWREESPLEIPSLNQ